MGASVAGSSVSQINADRVSGTGESIKNPLVNPNISQMDVGSTTFASKKAADTGDTRTMAFENKKEGLEISAALVDTDLNSKVLGAVMRHSGEMPKTSNENPTLTPKYGSISN
jgi:hypothetical protein